MESLDTMYDKTDWQIYALHMALTNMVSILETSQSTEICLKISEHKRRMDSLVHYLNAIDTFGENEKKELRAFIKKLKGEI